MLHSDTLDNISIAMGMLHIYYIALLIQQFLYGIAFPKCFGRMHQ